MATSKKNFCPKLISGFTLMELLLYSAILGVISLGLIGVFGYIFRYYYNVLIKANVSQNLRLTAQLIQQSVQQAASVNSASGTVLVLAMNDSSKNPTEFGLENGRIYKKEGAGDRVPLTAENIEVTDLQFSYLSTVLTKALSPHQWAWSGGASPNNSNEGVGWIDFNPSTSDVRIPLGAGDFLGMAYIPALDSYLSLNCLTTDSCSEVSYKVSSDSSGILSGWAWSDKFGWLSFNSADTTSTVPYRVSISLSTGEFMGWAWSENIGWVSFNCANSEVNSCGSVQYRVQANRRQGVPVNTVYVSMSMRSKSVFPQFVFSDSYTFSVPLTPISNLTVASVNPSAATSTVSFSITGTNFQSGASTRLARPGFPDIFPSVDCTFVSSTSLQSCQYNVSGKEKGFWDLIVTNPNGQTGILPKGFEIR